MATKKTRVLLIDEGNVFKQNGLQRNWRAWNAYFRRRCLPDFFIEAFISFLKGIKSRATTSQAEFEAFKYDIILFDGQELVLVAANPLPNGTPGKKNHQVGVEVMAKRVLQEPSLVPMKLYYFLDDRRTGRDTRVVMAGSETEAWAILAKLYKLNLNEVKKRFKIWREQTKNCDRPQVVI